MRGGERELAVLLAGLDPIRYVFALADDGVVPAGVDPVATVREAEGLTVVMRHDEADRAGLPYDGVMSRITCACTPRSRRSA